MATLVNSNYIGGEADIEVRMLLKPVPGGMKLEPTEAVTDVPVAVASCDHDEADDPASVLDFEILRYGHVYELIAAEEIKAGDEIVPDAGGDGKAAVHATHDNYWFVALDAASGDGKVFSAVFVGAHYFDAR